MGQAQAQGFPNCSRLAAQHSKTTTACRWPRLRSIRCATTSNVSSRYKCSDASRWSYKEVLVKQGLDAQRQTELQRLYEPYQRVEFLKGIMTNLPTTQSSITATTAPGSNPLSQALGTGLSAYSAYNMMQPR
jgi:hypothetical protein